MISQIIDGKKISADLRKKIFQDVQELRKNNTVPGLGVILVGNNPASKSYVRAKKRACEEIGIHSQDILLPETISETELLNHISNLNADEKIHGILVQLPLPQHINESSVLACISPEKDIDGFHAMSLGKLMLGQDTFISCTPHGIIQLLRSIDQPPEGRHCVIVGRSNIVGKPLANLLLLKNSMGNATVTVCHSRTPNVSAYTRQADILIAAIGQPETIRGSMIKPGAIVIDVGVNRIEDNTRKNGYRLVGDVAFDEARECASYITPVPGGVGPMTISMLLWNTVKAARDQLSAQRMKSAQH